MSARLVLVIALGSQLALGSASLAAAQLRPFDRIGTAKQERSRREIAAERWAGRSLVAGHADARFRFRIPAGLAPLRGVVPPSDPHDALQVPSAGPGGVGIPDGATIALDSIVVFSDPRGLRLDFALSSRSQREAIASRYASFIRERYPSVREPSVVEVGTRFAIRIDIPEAIIDGQPLRRGRHYLVFDGRATASVDCLWTDEEATLMSRACDEIAAGLERVESTR